MNVIGIQLNISWENKAANFNAVEKLLAATAPKPGSLVVLPEMFATGFSMNAEAIVENYGGETEQFLARIAREYRIVVIGGAAMKGRDSRFRNKALAFSTEGELIAFYTKMRPFTVGGESDHYVPGDKIATFEVNGWGIAPFICFDLRFPELFRAAVLHRRPELFVVIANWPEERVHHWVRLLQARAIENQAYVLGVNRVGNDPHYAYPGRSLVVDPHGDILADAGSGEGCIHAELDRVQLLNYRQGLPFLDDLKHFSITSSNSPRLKPVKPSSSRG